ncbi:MAG: substrate-binding domain-containing protein [Bacteroidales bacterium]|nr:substrate-binding domain-containing protein [Bacteroidales bacterium]
MSKFNNRSLPKGILILLSGLLICNACNPGAKSGDKLKGNISVSGAFALYPLTVSWAEEFKKLHPNVNIDINAGGAGKGMVDVLSGMVDLAMFSREVSIQETEKGAWKIAVARDAVFPTINVANPAYAQLKSKGLTRSQFLKLYTSSENLRWTSIGDFGSSSKINVYTRSDACGAASMWANYFDREQENLKGTGVYGDPGIAEAVKNDVNGVGFNNLIFIYNIKTNRVNDGLAIIPIDLNENGMIDPEEDFYGTMEEVMAAVRDGKYPSPPARNLYLISKGKPTNPAVKAFLEYILLKGQDVVSKAGYIKIQPETLEEQRALMGIKAEQEAVKE